MRSNSFDPCFRVILDPSLLILSLACASVALTASARPSAAQSRTVSFQPHREFATAGPPGAVAVGDFNGDGKLDMVTANTDSTVSLLLGNGDGTFATRHDYSTGGNSFFVAVGDLNGDGKLDMAVTNAIPGGYGSVSIFLGNGDGTFGSRTDYSVGGQPGPILISDLNNDGKPDLVVASGAAVSALLGNGDGTFAPVTDPNSAQSGGPHFIAIGDLNEDGKLDLVETNNDCGVSTVSVRLGNGDGTFGIRHDIGTSDCPLAVALGDFNGDGKLDAAVTVQGSGVDVFPGNGDGTFGSRMEWGAGRAAEQVLVGDFNADGKLDLAVSDELSNSVVVLLGNGYGYFYPQSSFATGNSPLAVAAGDFNGDGRPDLAVADAGSNAVTVLIQNPWTSASLASSLSPAVYGQSVTLMATVTPSAASGTIQFFDGGYVLGTAALSGGIAALTVTTFAAGNHSITATLEASPNYGGSTSAPLAQVVSLAGTTTSLGASVNPSEFRQPVSFTATVAPVSPGIGVPAGSVQFKIDGVDYGPPVALVGGNASSPSSSALSVGTHTVQASYLGPDTLRFSTSVSPAFSQVVQPSEPTIVAVRDVPNDQGGHVFVIWHFTLDQPGIQVVTGYRVWRRVPSLASASLRSTPNPVGSRALRTETTARRIRMPLPDSSSGETFWEAIADLPAAQLVSYGYSAPTTQDSITGSNPYTAFFIEALTSDPFVFFDSAPDSGYSVDNLAPRVPGPFTGTLTSAGIALHWEQNTEPDFREYRLYRGGSPTFVPESSNLVASKADTGYVDPSSAGSYYKLSAVDVHGNESGFATLSPAEITGVHDNSLPLAMMLGPVVPNPVLGAATVRLALPREALASLAIYDASGRRVRALLDEQLSAGVHDVPWDGRNDFGRRLSGGLYFVQLAAEGRKLTTRMAVIR